MELEFSSNRQQYITKNLSQIEVGEVFVNAVHDPRRILAGTYTASFAVYLKLDHYASGRLCDDPTKATYLNLKTGHVSFGYEVDKTKKSQFYILDATLKLDFIKS